MDKVSMGKTITPVFIFTLPRSGSTLLTRILGRHSEISVTSEPWLLLPFFFALRNRGVYAEYMHQGVSSGIRYFLEVLPNGLNDYHEAVREFALNLYGRAADQGARYFVDKTPRYSLIATDIIRAFPNAKFIFLWRNPLAIASSLIDSFGKGNWNLYDYYVDLFQGVDGLLEAHRAAAEKSFSIHYETLVEDPSLVIASLCEYLEVDYHEEMITDFPVEVVGLGDNIGSRKYGKTISNASKNNWKRTFCNPVRRFWARRYCRWLGDERLKHMGYRMEDMLDGLARCHSDTRSKVLSDTWRMLWGVFKRYFAITPFKDRFHDNRKAYPKSKIN